MPAMSDFDLWLEETVRPDKLHLLQEHFPGSEVRLAPIRNPIILSAEQAAALALRLLACAGVGVRDALFADGREPTRNERHLLNLLAWRENEIQRLRVELYPPCDEPRVVEAQPDLAVERANTHLIVRG